MRTWLTSAWSQVCRVTLACVTKFTAAAAALSLLPVRQAFAQATEQAGGEANLKLPDLSQVQFLGIDGHKLLLFGLIFCVFGLVFVRGFSRVFWFTVSPDRIGAL